MKMVRAPAPPVPGSTIFVHQSETNPLRWIQKASAKKGHSWVRSHSLGDDLVLCTRCGHCSKIVTGTRGSSATGVPSCDEFLVEGVQES
jgi:hypothetical protein